MEKVRQRVKQEAMRQQIQVKRKHCVSAWNVPMHRTTGHRVMIPTEPFRFQDLLIMHMAMTL